MLYRLHYAPDNASLIVRLALLELEQPFETILVDRRLKAQKSSEYLKLNPNGLIPVLEAGDQKIFETGAILLWLCEQHDALAGPKQQRSAFLTWLFWLSNTLHPALRLLFYPEKYIDSDPAHSIALRDAQKQRLTSLIDIIAEECSNNDILKYDNAPNILHFYLCTSLRWLALYPHDQTQWFELDTWPNLKALCEMLETRDSVHIAAQAEGLGPTVFSQPHYPNPPEGSAL